MQTDKTVGKPDNGKRLNALRYLEDQFFGFVFCSYIFYIQTYGRRTILVIPTFC